MQYIHNTATYEESLFTTKSSYLTMPNFIYSFIYFQGWLTQPKKCMTAEPFLPIFTAEMYENSGKYPSQPFPNTPHSL